MKSKINFTAIIAVAMIAMSMLVLGSCNADDDDYNFEYGTLAKGVITRGGDVVSTNPKDFVEPSFLIDSGSDTALVDVTDCLFKLIFDVQWGDGLWFSVKPHVSFKYCDDNGSPVVGYYDSNNNHIKLKKYQFVGIERYKNPYIHFGKIIEDGICVSYQGVKEHLDKNNQTIYTRNPIVEKAYVSLEYRIPDEKVHYAEDMNTTFNNQ